LDAVKHGFEVQLLVEGVRGVELATGDCDAAIIRMREAGVQIVKGQK
jgi:hypothetical protein